MKKFLAIGAVSLVASFSTPAFAAVTTAEVDAAIASCVSDASSCVAVLGALDLSGMTTAELASVAAQLTAASSAIAATNPTLASSLTSLAAAVETGSVSTEVVAQLASAN